jgi:hypothetical protein
VSDALREWVEAHARSGASGVCPPLGLLDELVTLSGPAADAVRLLLTGDGPS